MIKIMKSFLKKRSTLITFLDVLIIIGIMFFLKGYLNIYKPMQRTVIKNGIKYTAKINRVEFNKNEIFLVNLVMYNRKKAKQIITSNETELFNVIISQKDRLIYKRDILERKREEPKIIKINGYSKLIFSWEWEIDSNTEEEILPGDYIIRIYSNDLQFEFDLPFKIK